jgi:lactate dehydrogenase-like 2-hydroxyacid dehydrogenase
MRSKVICLRPKHDFDRANIAIPESFDIHFFPQFEEDVVIQASADADFILSPSHSPHISVRLIARAKALKLIQLCGSGYDAVDLEAANKAGIPVARSPGQNSRAVAEYSYNLINVLNRGILEGDLETKKGNYQWVRDKLRKEGIYELGDMNLGILGVGPVGKEMAKIGGFFGARLFYYDIVRLSREAEKELKLTFVDFSELLRISDILSLHIPINEKTKGIIGRKELASMKPSAILINTARGALVDDEALIDALKSNRLRGAAMDVFEPEPVPPDHLFLSVGPEIQKKLVLTPHLAGAARQSQNRMFQEAIQNILRVIRGEPPKHVVNLNQA